MKILILGGGPAGLTLANKISIGGYMIFYCLKEKHRQVVYAGLWMLMALHWILVEDIF